jgi:hypothetical protein
MSKCIFLEGESDRSERTNCGQHSMGSKPASVELCLVLSGSSFQSCNEVIATLNWNNQRKYSQRVVYNDERKKVLWHRLLTSSSSVLDLEALEVG